MSDTVQLALIASVAPTIAALAALFVSIKNSQKSDVVLEKSDVIIDKADEIHKLTNSSLTAMTKSLADANDRILVLEKEKEKKKK